MKLLLILSLITCFAAHAHAEDLSTEDLLERFNQTIYIADAEFDDILIKSKDPQVTDWLIHSLNPSFKDPENRVVKILAAKNDARSDQALIQYFGTYPAKELDRFDYLEAVGLPALRKLELKKVDSQLGGILFSQAKSKESAAYLLARLKGQEANPTLSHAVLKSVRGAAPALFQTGSADACRLAKGLWKATKSNLARTQIVEAMAENSKLCSVELALDRKSGEDRRADLVWAINHLSEPDSEDDPSGTGYLMSGGFGPGDPYGFSGGSFFEPSKAEFHGKKEDWFFPYAAMMLMHPGYVSYPQGFDICAMMDRFSIQGIFAGLERIASDKCIDPSYSKRAVEMIGNLNASGRFDAAKTKSIQVKIGPWIKNLGAEDAATRDRASSGLQDYYRQNPEIWSVLMDYGRNEKDAEAAARLHQTLGLKLFPLRMETLFKKECARSAAIHAKGGEHFRSVLDVFVQGLRARWFPPSHPDEDERDSDKTIKELPPDEGTPTPKPQDGAGAGSTEGGGK